MDAFDLASSVRYMDDAKLKTRSPDPSLINNFEAGLEINSLKISKEITPDLYQCLEDTCVNLFLDINKVNAYVTSSPEIQAGCVSFSKESCLILFMGTILGVNGINIGHELGHFLFSHNIEEHQIQASQEGYIKKRAQEISVDRIGLLACKDIDIATRAITKSLSGLDEKYITFNMRGFLNQLDSDVAKNESSGQFSSHPSFILRVKALLRFSLSEPFLRHTSNVQGTNISEIDKMIQNDLNIYIDKDLRRDIDYSKKMLSFWGYAFAYVKGGSFSKENQIIMANKFGDEMKDKLIKMVQSQSMEDAVTVVQNKLFDSINSYKTIAPNTARKELNVLLMKIEEETNQKAFFKEVLQKI